MAFLGTFNTQKPTAGSELTKGLVSGIGGYLEKLTESKAKEIERTRIAHGLQDIGYEPEEARGISNLPESIQKELVKDQVMAGREGRKASEKIVHDTIAAERGARENLSSLKRIEQLDREGNVQGVGGRILKSIGLGNLRSADTQELEKLTVGFLGNLKNVFGARPTQFDVQQYLNGLPNLLQSPEGRARVIKNLRVFNEGAKLRADALRQILKENKNRPPANLDVLIEDRIGDQLDRLHREISGGTDGGTSNSFQDLPDPSSLSGKKIRDTTTGQILQSNGKQWLPVGG